MSFGSLYPALRRLERKGLIEATKGEGRRKAYRISGSGREAFVRMLADVPEVDESDRGFQLRLAFFAHLDRKSRIRVLEDRRSALTGRLKGRVASFKIPRHVIFVDAFPMTSSGKIRKVELRADALERLGRPAAAG